MKVTYEVEVDVDESDLSGLDDHAVEYIVANEIERAIPGVIPVGVKREGRSFPALILSNIQVSRSL